MAKIYISSTYEDLAEHREAAYRALRQMRHDVLSMEDYSAADERPLSRCLRDVAASDVYVGLIAWRYGFIPPGHDKAITHLEYEQAGHERRPRLLFLSAEDAPWPPNLMDSDLGKIRTLRAHLRLNHLVEFFSNADDLAGAVSIAVSNLLAEPGEEANEGDGPTIGDADFLRRSLSALTGRLDSSIRFYLAIGGAVFGLGLALLVAGALLRNPALAIGAGLVLAFAMPPFSSMLSTRRRRDTLSSYVLALEIARPEPETVRQVRQFLTQQLAT